MNTGTQKIQRGAIVNFQFMFPHGLSRLLFAMRRKSENKNLIEQVIENPSREKGVAEVVITNEGAAMLDAGFYSWCIFGLANDGTRDTWYPFSEGEVEVFEEFPADDQLVFPFGFFGGQGLKNEEKSAIIQ
jgi:hypothetical protein